MCSPCPGGICSFSPPHKLPSVYGWDPSNIHEGNSAEPNFKKNKWFSYKTKTGINRIYFSRFSLIQTTWRSFTRLHDRFFAFKVCLLWARRVMAGHEKARTSEKTESSHWFNHQSYRHQLVVWKSNGETLGFIYIIIAHHTRRICRLSCWFRLFGIRNEIKSMTHAIRENHMKGVGRTRYAR